MKLKPCPFCGANKPHTIQSMFVTWYVICSDCCAAGGSRMNEKDAIAAWNRRQTKKKEARR